MNATLEGQTTSHYVAERLEAFPVRLTQLAHGLPVGGELDYLDERSEEHTSELQSLMRISYAVFCLQKKNSNNSISIEYNYLQRTTKNSTSTQTLTKSYKC